MEHFVKRWKLVNTDGCRHNSGHGNFSKGLSDLEAILDNSGQIVLRLGAFCEVLAILHSWRKLGWLIILSKTHAFGIREPFWALWNQEGKGVQFWFHWVAFYTVFQGTPPVWKTKKQKKTKKQCKGEKPTIKQTHVHPTFVRCKYRVLWFCFYGKKWSFNINFQSYILCFCWLIYFGLVRKLLKTNISKPWLCVL